MEKREERMNVRRRRGETRRSHGHHPPPFTGHTSLSFFSSSSFHWPLLLNKKPDANACKVLEDWISSLSFSSPRCSSSRPFSPSFFLHSILFTSPHPSLPLLLTLPPFSTVLKLKMCRGLGFGDRVYFGAVIKFIACHTHTYRHTQTNTHTSGQGNHTTVYSGLLLYYL